MERKRWVGELDQWLILAVCALSVFGIVCIGSATHINLGESASTLYKQIAWFLIGLGMMAIAAGIDYQYFSRFYLALYAANLLLLIAVLFIGNTVNGATRWILIGPASIQPSEFAKLVLIICLAKYMEKKRDSVNEPLTLFVACAATLVPIYLIQKQPSLSASLVLLAILGVELFTAGLSYKLIRNVLVVVVPFVAFVFWDVSREAPLIMDKILKPHQFNRILAFVDPASNMDVYYQTEKAIHAIGSGQLRGKGLFQGTLNQLSYLPEPHNDFIFSVIGEEFGFLGCIFVVILLLFIVFRCILIAISTEDLFSRLLAAGVAGMIAFQTFVNIGVSTGIMPNTGMSLPFVSYGGSSMWTNMLAIGLVLNIKMKQQKGFLRGF